MTMKIKKQIVSLPLKKQIHLYIMMTYILLGGNEYDCNCKNTEILEAYVQTPSKTVVRNFFFDQLDRDTIKDYTTLRKRR
jgi:hypothetical protein